ncbi:endonuclease/exonuclease/phosphatase family protein [Micromonospora olivasterospora]|uniref:Endonuclease/exonuclease/phosphatase family metal-dependent hydrolase n=1 Tax=Micromonospora olivasterospora TaxID=1880 RepID=A0A562IDU8_MICOL|nr:endonuclease/exonuclease/phosphatase family protein [Micromonospora olivasterospora]TWH68794.1 endonuclease/exonuclease/phosphatase family metal-dependent hydrolase [Micromonospora olivasterospora]
MRHRHLETATLAVGVVVLADVLRVFLPSVITVFGQAAATPAPLLGAFALGWFVLALFAPALVRRLGARPVATVAAVALAAARLALTAAPGGRTQLWLATVGLLAGLVWLAGTAARTDRPLPGLALGLALGAVTHAAVDTYDLVWRSGWAGWAGSGALVALFLAGTARLASTPAASASPARPGGARVWLLAGPALLLTGMVALSPAVAGTASSYRRGPAAGLAGPPVAGDLPILLASAVALFLLAALARPPRGPARLCGPVAALAGAALFAADRPGWLAPAILLTAAGTGGCLSLAGTAPPPSVPPAGPGQADGRPTRPALAAVLGMLVFAVAVFAYHAAYDLGYPNGSVPVAVAGFVAVVALAPGRVRASAAGAHPRVPPRLRSARIAAGAFLCAFVAAGLSQPAPATSRHQEPPTAVRVVAYNVRMGYGLDGRLDPDGLATVVAGQQPDVVVLSEVDRGWLLNGGHDVLTLLARRLGMTYVFAPAADPLWGDAVLSGLPLASARTRKLAAAGAPTGAQALGVTVDIGGGAGLAVVATHLQPPPGREPVAQARAVADFALGYAAGRPLVVAGNLNTEPGAPAYAELTRAGLVDALAAARPQPTSPAGDPRTEIDHVLVRPGTAVSHPAAPRSTASDHLPVAVTVHLPPP